jgi:hypothetical protein
MLNLYTLLLAWSVTETIRYPYYALKESAEAPELLTWLRYTTFIVLYPLGVMSELAMVWLALPWLRSSGMWSWPMPNWANLDFHYHAFCVLMMAAYVPGASAAATHARGSADSCQACSVHARQRPLSECVHSKSTRGSASAHRARLAARLRTQSPRGSASAIALRRIAHALRRCRVPDDVHAHVQAARQGAWRTGSQDQGGMTRLLHESLRCAARMWGACAQKHEFVSRWTSAAPAAALRRRLASRMECSRRDAL